MEDKGKWIAGILMVALAVGIYFFGSTIIHVPNTCSGLAAWINPICWLGFAGDLAFSIIFGIIAVWTLLFAIAIFVASQEKTIWIMLLYVALTLTLINFVLPDPIPFVDEIVGVGLSAVFGIKSLGDRVPEKLQVF